MLSKWRFSFFMVTVVFSTSVAFGQLQGNVEKNFLRIPRPDSCRRNLFILTQEPHIAGSAEDSILALFVKNRLAEDGIDSKIVTYYVYLPYPKSEELEMTEPEKYKFNLEEGGWSWDKDSYNSKTVLPFNAYSPSGTISGQIVYANYGLPEDYEYLAKLGIDVKNKIILVRYGRSFRGIKVKVAEERGAGGVIIYSDPADDGYDQGDIYPRGPMRPWDAVQRGSIQDLTIYPGDPLTPGYASTKDAHRIAQSEVTDLPHIPCLPISYANAKKLLDNLAGPVVPHEWQGGLPLAYHIGPGSTEVMMKIEMDYAIRPIWDVIGTIEGKIDPNQKVIIGNHRDAWVFGAVDPNSGTASMLETARGFGMLLKSGWRPSRTIVICSWDGEEYGLLGSTEWGEENETELANDAVAYINIDAPVSGSSFGSSSVPSLDKFIMDVTKAVVDPKSKKSVFDSWYMSQNKTYFENHESVPDTAATTIGRLGSGSDFTVFLDHIGIPSFDFGFGGPYGVYHSALDNFYWMEHWGDPTFEYHATVAKLLGIATIRLADDSLLPFRYSDYANEIEKYTKALEKTAHEDENLKSVDFSPAINAAIEFGNIAARTDSLFKVERIGDYSAVNSALMDLERAFTNKDGLPQSLWFKHQIYAPGFYTGYASQPLPGVARAIESKNQVELEKELKTLEGVLKKAVSIEDEIAKRL